MNTDPNLVPTTDPTRYLYLTNLAETPGRDADGRPEETAIGVLRMRLDGFVCFEAGYAAPALLTTVPLVVGGSRLLVNLEAPNGALRVALLGDDGQAIAGYGFDDAVRCTVLDC